ncbi:MAG: 50S ribosomal protein L10 [Bacilli bacterium]|nr:50S ribosomal protein L10 [Acholeplasmataceae bacterium]
MKKATIDLKAQKVAALAQKFRESESLVFVDYLGLTVAEITELRRKLHENNCEFQVIKNNILRRASKEVGYDLDEVFVGPNAVAFSKDATSASKIIFDFLKDYKNLEVKAGVVEGKVMDKDELKVIAKLPDKNGMIAMLLSVLQAPIRNLACVIKAVAEKEA